MTKGRKLPLSSIYFSLSQILWQGEYYDKFYDKDPREYYEMSTNIWANENQASKNQSELMR